MPYRPAKIRSAAPKAPRRSRRARALQTLTFAAAASVSFLGLSSSRAADATWLINPTDGNWVATGTENNWGMDMVTYTGGTGWLGDNDGTALNVARSGPIANGPIVNTAMTTATWTGAGTDTTWGNTGNWSGGVVPGVPGTTSLTDTSTANFVGTATNTTPTLETSYNLQNINFGSTAATTLSSYTISNTTGSSTSGNSFLLTNGGTIQLGSGVTSTGLTETINAPMVLEPGSNTTIGGYTFANNIGDTTSVLSFAGNISGGTTSYTNGSDGNPDGGSIILTLQGTNTGLNTVSGVISDGGAGSNTVQRGLAVRKFGTGTWYLTGTNTFSGELEVSQGILNVASLSNYGVASAIGSRASASDQAVNGGVGILIDGGTLQYTGSTAQSTNRNIRLSNANGGVNTIDASGTGSGTMSFTHTGADVNLFQGTTSPNLTLTGTNTSNNTFAISLTQGVNLVKNGTGTWVIAPEFVDSNSSSFSGGTTINAGTLIAGAGDFSTTAGVFGGSSRTVNLGATSGTASASLLNAGYTVGEAITVRSGNTGVKTIGSSSTTAGTFSGNVTLNTGVTLQGFTGGTINFATGVISGGQAVTIGSTGNTGVVNLSGVETYSGATNVNFGTLQVSGAGSINTTTGITVNGSTAEYLQTSSVASTRAITLTQGILDGTGTVGAVTVGNNTGGIVQNGNGSSATLTLASLTFSGTGTANLIESSTASTTVGRLAVTGALTAPGTVTLNLSGTFANGTNDLISYGSLGAGTTLSDFTLGTVMGLNSRQAAGALSLSGNNIVLTVTGDSPKWTGLDNGNWQTGTTGPNHNWKLITSGTPTDFQTNDTVLFDDTATGTTALSISNANVSVSGVTFNNSSLAYSVSSSGGYGITGAGSLTKNGTALVTLNTTNSYTGGTTVNAGTLTGTAAGSFGTGNVTVNPTGTAGTSADAATLNSTGSIASTAAVTVNSNSATAIGTINLNGAAPTIGSLAGTGSVVLNNPAGTVLTIGSTNNLSGSFSGVISQGAGAGAGSLVKAGTGTETLSGADTYTGSTTINAGMLTLGNAQAIGAPTTASVIFGSGTSGTLQLNGNNVTVIDLTTNATTPGAAVIQSGSGTAGTDVLTVNTANSDTYAGVLQNGSMRLLGLTKSGAGTLTLSGTNSYTGGTSVNGGTLAATDDTNAFGGNFSGITVAIGNAGTVLLTTNANNTYNNTFSGSGLLKFAFSTVGSDTVANNFNAFSGTLEIGSANGGSQKLQLSTAQPTALSSATLQIDNGGQFFTGANVNFGTIKIIGTGNNENRGAIRLNGSGTSSGVIGGNVLLLGSASIGAEGGTLTGNISSGVAGTQTLSLGGNSSSGSALLSGNLSDGNGVLALTNGNNATTTLSGTNTYSGVTTVNGGTLKAGSTGAFSANSAVTFANIASTVLDTTGFNTTVGSLTGGGTNGGNVTLGAATLTVGGDNTSPAAYAGIISGTGGLTKIGTGTQMLSGANNYTGVTTISGGTVQLGNATALPANTLAGGTGLVINTGGTLGVNGNSITFPATPAGTGGAITNVSGTLATLTFSGGGALAQAVTGNLALAVTGGTLAANATSTYTGATTVSGGTLSLTKAGSAPDPSTFLTTGGTLNGTPGITVNSGGTLLQGASNAISSGNANMGTGNGGTSVTLAGGTYAMGTGVTQGQGANVVNGANDGSKTDVPGLGALTLTSNSTLSFLGSSGTLVFNGYVLNGKTLSILGTNFATTTGNSSDGVTDRLIFENDTAAPTTAQLAEFNFTGYSNNGAATDISMSSMGINYYEIVPTGTAVPETSTWVGGLLSLGAMGYRLRRNVSRLFKRARLA